MGFRPTVLCVLCMTLWASTIDPRVYWRPALIGDPALNRSFTVLKFSGHVLGAVYELPYFSLIRWVHLFARGTVL